MRFYLGIDLGTTYFKAGIWNASGKECGLGRVSVPKIFTGNRCEIAADDFWEAIRSSIAQALDTAGISAADLAGVSYSSQANSFILLDSNAKPLTPLVLWMDHRADGDCDAVRRLCSRADFLKRTGIGVTVDGEWMIAKLDWFKRNEPEIWARTANVMTISDYLVYGLSSRKVSDLSTASMTCLLDVQNGRWWEEALEAVGLDKAQLSEPMPTGTKVGGITAFGAAKTGLKQGTPLYLGCLDHHAVAIGAGILNGKSISESTGTVLAAVSYSDGYDPAEGIITAPGLDRNHFFRLAFDGNGATAVEWYQRNYAPGQTILQLEDEARSVPAGCDGLVALPRSDSYSGLEGFRNVRPEHTPAHFIRAIFESTATTLVQLVGKLDPEGKATEMIPSGGGARNTLWLQIKARMLHRSYSPQPSGELATKGAAMICTLK